MADFCSAFVLGLMTEEKNKDLMSEEGQFYLVAVKQNGIQDIQRRMKEEFHFDSKVWGVAMQFFVSFCRMLICSSQGRFATKSWRGTSIRLAL